MGMIRDLADRERDFLRAARFREDEAVALMHREPATQIREGES